MDFRQYNSLLLVVGLLLCTLDPISAEDVPSCKNEDGDPVDWYIAYKLPKLKRESAPFDQGEGYLYITSDDVPKVDLSLGAHDSESFGDAIKAASEQLSTLFQKYVTVSTKQKITGSGIFSGRSRSNSQPQWTISSRAIGDQNSLILGTLQVAYDDYSSKAKKLNTIFYNDSPPKYPGVRVPDDTKAHAKGVVVMNEENGAGMWLSHSIPKFPPPLSEHLEFSNKSLNNGQTFICMNFDLNKFGPQIVNHLVTMKPLVYESLISESLISKIPQIAQLNHNKRLRARRNSDPAVKLAQIISTRAGQTLHLYSKSPHYHEDIYSQWIDEDVKMSLYVQTWRRATGVPINSTCQDLNVNNVKLLRFPQSHENSTWSYLTDHSKWAISQEEGAFSCLSSINRMKSQFKRGGEAICMFNPSIRTVFDSMILDTEPCPRTIRRKQERIKTMSKDDNDEPNEETVDG